MDPWVSWMFPSLNACLNFFSSRTFGVKSRKGVLTVPRAHALDNQIFRSRVTFLSACQHVQSDPLPNLPTGRQLLSSADQFFSHHFTHFKNPFSYLFLMLRAAFSSFKPFFTKASFSTMTNTAKPCKLALIQLAVTADKDANLANARTHVLEAASKGANLIVLPVRFPSLFYLFLAPPCTYTTSILTPADTHKLTFYTLYVWESRSASIRLMELVTSPNTPKLLRTVLQSSHSPPWPKYVQFRPHFSYPFWLLTTTYALVH